MYGQVSNISGPRDNADLQPLVIDWLGVEIDERGFAVYSRVEPFV